MADYKDTLNLPKTKFEMRDDGPVLVRLPKLNFIDDKEGKPVGINSHIGRRPIAAFGNSDGDLQMLQWTCAGGLERLMVVVHHTDAEREWAYDRDSHIGKLDEALEALQAEDPRKARAIELRYFGGINLEEIAAVTDVSIATVHRRGASPERTTSGTGSPVAW